MTEYVVLPTKWIDKILEYAPKDDVYRQSIEYAIEQIEAIWFKIGEPLDNNPIGESKPHFQTIFIDKLQKAFPAAMLPAVSVVDEIATLCDNDIVVIDDLLILAEKVASKLDKDFVRHGVLIRNQLQKYGLGGVQKEVSAMRRSNSPDVDEPQRKITNADLATKAPRSPAKPDIYSKYREAANEILGK